MKKIISVLVLSVCVSACVEESYTQSNYSSRVSSSAVAPTAYQQHSTYSSNTVRSNRYVTAPPANNGYVSRVE